MNSRLADVWIQDISAYTSTAHKSDAMLLAFITPFCKSKQVEKDTPIPSHSIACRCTQGRASQGDILAEAHFAIKVCV